MFGGLFFWVFDLLYILGAGPNFLNSNLFFIICSVQDVQ
jgi:hypothetical protein